MNSKTSTKIKDEISFFGGKFNTLSIMKENIMNNKMIR